MQHFKSFHYPRTHPMSEMVMRVISMERQPLLLFTQLLTYRCIAQTDALGQISDIAPSSEKTKRPPTEAASLQADEHASWGPLPEPLVAVDDNVGNNP